MPQTLLLRSMVPTDWPGIWGLLEPVFRAGETFPHDPAITEAEAHHQWVELSQVVVVAVAVDVQHSDGVQAGEERGPFWGATTSSPIPSLSGPMWPTLVMWWQRPHDAGASARASASIPSRKPSGSVTAPCNSTWW